MAVLDTPVHRQLAQARVFFCFVFFFSDGAANRSQTGEIKQEFDEFKKKVVDSYCKPTHYRSR